MESLFMLLMNSIIDWLVELWLLIIGF